MISRYLWVGLLSFLLGIMATSSLMNRDYTHKSRTDVENNMVSRIVFGVSSLLTFFFLIIFTFLWGYRVPEELAIIILAFFAGLAVSPFLKIKKEKDPKNNKEAKKEEKIP